MKTSIKTTLATALALLFFVATASATFAETLPADSTIPASKMNVNMVVVTGDIDIYLIHSDIEDIKIVSNSTRDADVSVKKRGAKLMIKGSNTERVTMYVYLKNLVRIDASNTAYVKTQGNFKLPALQIFLKDAAKANVDIETGSLYSVVRDHAELKLKGVTGNHELMKSAYANLKTENFEAASVTTITLKPVYAANK